MKHFFFFTILFFFLFFFVIDCSGFLDEHTDTNTVSSTPSSLVTATESVDWAYSSSVPYLELTPQTADVTISGSDLPGKSVYLVKINSTNTSLSQAEVRVVESYTGIQNEIIARTAASVTDDEVHEIPALEGGTIQHFTEPAADDSNELTETQSRAIQFTAPVSVEKTDWTVGDTKLLFVDGDPAMSSYSKETATLRAVGSYCYVWTVGPVYNGSASTRISSDRKITSLLAREFAEKFDGIYKLVTHVYGSESDKLYAFDGKGFTQASMESFSDTGTKVNIVLYDIGKSGVVGYFYSKDYYESPDSYPYDPANYRRWSNAGKYIYIDSQYAGSGAYTVAGTTYDYTDLSFSTLAHEFQHMILFGQKKMRYGIKPAAWYNEMLSMICEDLLQEQLGVDDNMSPKGRLGKFNALYHVSGVSDFISADGSYLASYASVYAFGAWLVRAYGGASFVRTIASNAQVNSASVLAAIGETTGSDILFSALVEKYVRSLILSDSEASLNKSASESPWYIPVEYGLYSYPLQPINLYDVRFAASASQFGPYLFSAGDSVALRPYGFSLHSVGVADNSTVTISLTKTGISSQRLVLIVE